MVVVNGGALVRERTRNAASLSDRLEGFLSIHWHGAHDGGEGIYPEVGVVVDVVRDSKMGQFDLCFCSPACLRVFLNSCVDEFESRLERVAQKHGRTKQSRRRRTKTPRA
jgi:hypothetical protein